MAVRNRNEAITQVNTLIVPQVTNVIHRDLLNNNILNSVLFRKDVIASTTATAGAATADFSNADLITLAVSDSVNISFTGLENGDVKYLYVTKPNAKSVTFAAATEITPFIKNITDLKTAILYQIYNKNGIVLIKAIADTLPEAIEADIAAQNAYKIPTAKAVYDYVLTRENSIINYVDNEIFDLDTALTADINTKVSIAPTQNITITETVFGATVASLTAKYKRQGEILTFFTTFQLNYSGAMLNPKFQFDFGLGANTITGQRGTGWYNYTTPFWFNVFASNPNVVLETNTTIPNNAFINISHSFIVL